jgi:argininosuccinate lyase
MPFRSAHDVVGRLAAESVRRGVPLDQLPEDLLNELCPGLIMGWKELFDPIRSLRSRSAVGGPSPENVSKRLDYWKSKLSAK